MRHATEIIASDFDQQATFGCVPAAAVPMVADALNPSRAEAHGVVTFYHDFRRTGDRTTELVRAESEETHDDH